MGYKIFNGRTDVSACDCTGGCMGTVRESALKVESGRKIPCRTGESNLRRRRAGRMPYQLSYNRRFRCVAGPTEEEEEEESQQFTTLQN